MKKMKSFFYPTAADISIWDELTRAIVWAVIISACLFGWTSQLDIDREGHQDTNREMAIALDAKKPVNEPSFKTHRVQAEKLCGEPVVSGSAGVTSEDVVVVTLNGKMVIMDLGEAFDRVRSNNHALSIWVIGVCKSHVIKD